MKKIALLGSSGSIGQNVLNVIQNLPDDFSVEFLSVYSSIDVLIQQAQIFHPSAAAIIGPLRNKELENQFKKLNVELFFGEEGLLRAVQAIDFDIFVNAIVGAAGLLPTLCAVERGKTIALANKETMVMAGELVTQKATAHQAKIIPVDSEHSAIFQCLQGEKIDEVRRIILTGSGGPFFDRSENHFDKITVEETLAHPNWKMGKKITVDSASLMNKGLEIIEAFWLFGLPLAKIDLVIHPQSIIHSLVEFVDGSVKAQLGWPDMKIPIQYALTYPAHKFLHSKELNFAALGQLTFFKPDSNKFPNLRLALEAIEAGGTAPTVLNAANEEAVQHFLRRGIGFSDIPVLIAQALNRHKVINHPCLEEILETNSIVREYVRDLILSGKVATGGIKT